MPSPRFPVVNRRLAEMRTWGLKRGLETYLLTSLPKPVTKPLILVPTFFLVLLGSILAAGVLLSQPRQVAIGPPPGDLGAKTVRFPSTSGATLHGWLVRGRSGRGFVVLMHGVRANRLAMERRALVLRQHEFGVLLFDFQAHGESRGKHITFGRLEGLDAAAAVAYARQQVPHERIGVIGVSLGGAAALLGPKPLDVDGLILESVYPDINCAIRDRIRLHLGHVAGDAAASVTVPILDFFMPFVLGVGAGELQPIDGIGRITAPLLLISGTSDAHTTIAEADALFAQAPEPKQFWAVEGAAHVDIERFDTAAYWSHVMPFLTAHLQGQ